MKHLAALAGAAGLFLASLSLAGAQTPPVAPAAKPTQTAPAKPAAAAPAARTAKSKECSAQADQKGLHGKERKKFRDACKKA